MFKQDADGHVIVEEGYGVQLQTADGDWRTIEPAQHTKEVATSLLVQWTSKSGLLGRLVRTVTTEVVRWGGETDAASGDIATEG